VATTDTTVGRRRDGVAGVGRRRLSTETRRAFQTTEFFSYLAAVAGVLIAAWLIDEESAGDVFRADKAWALVAGLTAAYMISRGLAKSGSSEPYWEDSGTNRD
jgi:hypothetical protein